MMPTVQPGGDGPPGLPQLKCRAAALLDAYGPAVDALAAGGGEAARAAVALTIAVRCLSNELHRAAFEEAVREEVSARRSPPARRAGAHRAARPSFLRPVPGSGTPAAVLGAAAGAARHHACEAAAALAAAVIAGGAVLSVPAPPSFPAPSAPARPSFSAAAAPAAAVPAPAAAGTDTVSAAVRHQDRDLGRGPDEDRHPRPSPAVPAPPAPGALSVPSLLALRPGGTATLLLSADGGPVSWSAAASPGVFLSADSGTIGAGQSAQVTVTLAAASGRITFTSGAVVTVTAPPRPYQGSHRQG